MNPFLHNAVASVQAPPVRVSAPRLRARRRLRWPRAFGTLALAAGLSLVVMPARALDVNTATVEQLRAIRGVGPKTAETIVKERERNGRFESMEDLSDRVRGIGPRRAQALESAGLRVAPGAKAPAGMRGAPGAASGAPAAGQKKDGRAGRVPPRGGR
jgi:competence protein ComEA